MGIPKGLLEDLVSKDYKDIVNEQFLHRSERDYKAYFLSLWKHCIFHRELRISSMRKELVIRILGICVLLGQCIAQKSIIILTPKVIRPGHVENITVTVIKSNINNATIKATLEDLHGNILSKTNDTFQSHVPKTLQLKIPGEISSLTSNTQNYGIHLHGNGSLSFESTIYVSLQKNDSSIFIQTDKGTYKAGQTIQIRSFALHPNNSIYTGNITLEVQDPNSNVIKRWSNLRNESYGVLARSLNLDDQPVLGAWSIKATVGGATKRAVVNVDEYVLPRFKLEVTFPQSALVSDREVSGSVVATYTYGRPVSGRVNISVTIPSLRSQYWGGDVFTDSRHITKKETFTIPLKHLTDHATSDHANGAQLKVDVKFTEDNTNKTVSETSFITLRNEAIQFSITHKGSNRYIPGFVFPIQVVFTDSEGRPPAKQLNTLHLLVFSSSTMKIEEDKRVSIPSNGSVELNIYTPNKTNVDILEVQVIHNNVIKRISLYAYVNNQTYMKLRVLSFDHRVGQAAKFQIQVNKPITEVYYQLVARGNLVFSGRHVMNGLMNSTFDVQLNEEMAPETSILVYNADPDTGDIYTDIVSISVLGMLKYTVSLTFGQTQVQPGDKVNLNVHTVPQSTVYLSVVDTSSLVLGNDNEITEESIVDSLKQGSLNMNRCRFQSHTTADAYIVTDTTELGTWLIMKVVDDVQTGQPCSGCRDRITNCAAYGKSVCGNPMYTGWVKENCAKFCSDYSGLTQSSRRTLTGLGWVGSICNTGSFAATYGGGFTGATSGGTLTGTGSGTGSSLSQSPGGSSTSSGGHLVEAKHVRSKFPETWLWTSQHVGDSGNVTISSTIPDSITSWVASAFSINMGAGIGVTHSTSKLNVFRPFFINMNLPFSVIHGEEVVLQINIFNYMTENLTVLVTLEQNSDFQNIVVDNLGYTHHESITKTADIQVNSGQSESVFFPIIPSIIGDIDISVKAQSIIAADAVIRKLKVEAEGVPKEYNVPLIIDLSNKSSQIYSVPVEFPSSLVQGSERVDVLVIGDYLGPSVSGFDKLLRLPMGCGEQTMSAFAPDVYVYQYLQQTGQLTDQLKYRTLNYMQRGYQRMLKFRHTDSSFSVWGSSDYYGSTWLTAYVLKTFSQSMAHIDIDNNVLVRVQRWLVQRQESDGSFRGYTGYHMYQVGGSRSTVILTAFVTIALMESKKISNAQVYNALRRSREYLERHADNLQEAYDIAITCYALHLGGSPKAATVMRKLEHQHSQFANIFIPWKSSRKSTNYLWNSPNTRAAPMDIETSAYALLYYTKSGQYVQAQKIIQWILRQRNVNGGFASTQDTVIALQALSESVHLTSGVSTQNVDVTVNTANVLTIFNVNERNKMVLQKFTPVVPREVNVTASGQGLALVQVAVNYNIKEQIEKPTFVISVASLTETMETISTRICTRYNSSSAVQSGMAILEFGVPSGFEADLEKISYHPDLKKSETDERKIILYFDKITQKEACVTIYVERSTMVANVKPSPVRVYEYYNPANQVTTLYTPSILKHIRYCDVCPSCACGTQKK